MSKKISETYSPNWATKFRYNKRLGITLDLIQPLLNSETTMLDLGCGDGAWLKFVAPYIKSGLGVDLGWSEVSAFWDERPSNIEFVLGDFQSSEMPDHFDILTCFETLEHVQNPSEIMDLMYEKLKPGGVAVVSVPIELGPSLLAKQITALLMRYKRSQNPEEAYSLSELVKATFHSIDDIKSYREKSGWFGHKGFDYREVEQLFSQRFSSVECRGTPIPLFKKALNVGVIFYGIKS